MYHFADAGKTNPIRTRSNPISENKKLTQPPMGKRLMKIFAFTDAGKTNPNKPNLLNAQMIDPKPPNPPKNGKIPRKNTTQNRNFPQFRIISVLNFFCVAADLIENLLSILTDSYSIYSKMVYN